MARERIVARSDEDRESFLRKRGFSKSETAKIIETVLSEENTKPQSIFDFVAGHHRARSQQDPSGHPPRIGGQGQETIAARLFSQSGRAATVPRGSPSAQSSNIIESSISADPKIRAGGGRASPALRAAREVTK